MPRPRRPKRSWLGIDLRHDRVIRAAVIGLLVYAIGLIPFYLLSPVHDSVQSLLGRSASNDGERAFLIPRKPASPARQIGADTRSVVSTTPAAQQTAVPMPTAASGDSQFAFLLLGYGGGGHDGAYLTDSMMVVIVDPARKTLTLLSLPRDSWVPLFFDGRTAVYNKVNTAYAFAKDPSLYPDRLARYTGDQGPGNFAMDTVSRLLGIPITYYLGLDFQGFREMIDAVGGIDVTVPDSFSARYPRNDDPSIDASWMVVRFTKGMEHMNGERAIEFARARETLDNPSEGTDFARARRQRIIIEAFKTRVLQPGGLIHLPQLLAIASQHVDTNYAIPDVAQLSRLILGWRDVRIYQTALTTANYLEDATGPDGAYLAVPSSPDHSWAQIRAFAHRLWSHPALGVAMARTTIVVENDTGVAGVAGRVSTALLRLGYVVGDPTSGPLLAHSELVDQTGGADPVLVQQLQQDLGLSTLALTDPPPGGAAVNRLLLRLGADAADLTITVPRDTTAPSSTVGVVKFGIWPYVPPRPTPEAAGRTAAEPTPTPGRANRRPNAPPGPSGPMEVTVPSVIGLPAAEAQRLLVDAGLTTLAPNEQTINDVFDKKYFLSIPVGHVLSQSPAPGVVVARGTRVAIAVRKS